MLIKNLTHLKKLCKGRSQLDCYVKLNGGLRSSKTLLIDSNRKGLVVVNEIDDTTEEFDSFKDLVTRHLTINEALQKNSFYVFDYEVEK